MQKNTHAEGTHSLSWANQAFVGSYGEQSELSGIDTSKLRNFSEMNPDLI
jgi:hypothetical protein